MTSPVLGAALFELLVRATVLLVGALLIAIPLRRASAASRHAFWTATTLALLAMPLLQARLPRLELPWWTAATTGQAAMELPAPVMVRDASAPTAAVTVDELPVAAGVIAPAPTDGTPWSLAVVAGLAWLLGGVGFAIPIAFGMARARRLARRAAACTDARIVERFERARRAVGIRRPVALLESHHVRTPMTGGVLHPVVLLPSAAWSWSDDRLDAVLRHELVHVRRADALRQLASRCSVALYWFHPLAWRTARLGARAREQACDEAVLRLGTRPSHYARHLLELADPTPAPAAMPALVRLDHPDLEERVMAILRAQPAPASRRLTLVSTIAIAAWSLGVAAAAPAQEPPAPPAPPRAPSTPVVALAPTPPVVAAADAAVLAPMPAIAPLAPEVPDAPVAPAAPASVAAPLPPLVPVADCEISGGGYRTTGSRDAGPTRMMSTTVGDTRLCVSVRGKTSESKGFIPSRPLPAGVQLTLASNGPGGSQRLEITGTPNGDQQHWFVDGRERPFDASAAEWRDAMLAYVGTASEKSRIHGKVAEIRGEMASVRGEEARLRGRIAEVRGRDAEYAGRIAEARAVSADRQAAMADRQAVEGELRQQEVELRNQLREQEMVVARQARELDRQARSVDAADRPAARAKVAEMRRQQEAELDQVRAQYQEQVAKVRAETDRRRIERKAEFESQQGVMQEREAKVRAARDAYNADARVAEIEDRIRSADVQGRVAAGQRRIDAMQVEKRIAEIDARLEPLEARLQRAIERVKP